MRPKWKVWLIAAAVLLVVIIAASAVFRHFTSEGIHIIGRFMHIDLQTKCYFLEGHQDLEIAEESTFTVSGFLNHRHYNPYSDQQLSSSFDGFMDLDAYPISLKNGFHAYDGSIQKKNGVPVVCLGYDNMFAEPNEPKLKYMVNILPDSGIVVVSIWAGDTFLTAVSGDSPSEALENYREYHKIYFNTELPY